MMLWHVMEIRVFDGSGSGKVTFPTWIFCCLFALQVLGVTGLGAGIPSCSANLARFRPVYPTSQARQFGIRSWLGIRIVLRQCSVSLTQPAFQGTTQHSSVPHSRHPIHGPQHHIRTRT
ncbi:hypothetical protein V8F20_004314 [Naviculisporaceae sp. PSN 640]